MSYKKVSPETKQTLKWLRTELVASMALFDREKPEVQSYNQAMSKAVHFLDKYIEGKGLFQITPKEKKK